MNLINGKVIDDEACESILENLDEMIVNTLRKPPLDINTVINACDVLVRNIDSLDVVKSLPELGVSPLLTDMYIHQLGQMLRAESIRERLKIELGADFDKPRKLTYLHSGATAVQTIAPLGVLFHITAGNVDGLPFISILDGLLTGNINLVKLPKEEGGITVSVLEELFKIEPALCEYVYIFDYSSKDIHAMKTLAAAANAVIVWGGDEAVRAVRSLVDPNTRIIEWGHKISFAYVTKEGICRDSLEKLALNICLTNQLFCSSCQGVFLDTDDMQDVYDFCETFLPVLEKVCQENPFAFDAAEKLFIQAQITSELYHRQIQGRKSGNRVFRQKNCSVTAYADSKLETSILYRNPWVRPLKREDILNLRPYKSYLQTAALLCADQEYEVLSHRLLQAGLVIISDGFEMSNYAFGEAHDGVHSMRCYTKLVSVQNQTRT